MKKDLVTVVIAALIGFIAAYFVTNLFYPAIEAVQVRTLGETVTSSIAMPSEDIFNFRSINPTVEVYVGQCKEYNENGDCVDSAADSAEDNGDEATDENQDGSESDTESFEESGNGYSD